MFKKRADYTISLVDMQPLNAPDFKESFLKDQKLSVNKEIVNETIQKIAASYKKSNEKSGDGADAPVFDLESEIEQHPDSLFIKCFAIKADEPNDNGDFFSRDELIKATSSFVGVPLFTNHTNSDINEARGKVVHSWWDEEKNGIMIIGRVDAAAYPQLARGIKEEYVVGTSMGCFTGSMRVLTATGEYIPIKEIQPGDLVYTHLGNIKSVKSVQRHLDKENDFIYQIKAEGIPEIIECTKEHPFFILKEQEYCSCGCGQKLTPTKSPQPLQKFRKRQIRGHYQKNNIKFDDIKDVEFCWKKSQDLQVGDFVSFPIPSEEKNSPDSTVSKARLIGYFLAEGSFNKDKGIHNTVVFSLAWKEKETLAQEIHDLLRECFPKNTVSFQKRKAKGTIVVLCYGKNVANWFLDHCGEYSYKKKLKTECLTWPKEIQRHIVGAWLARDGHQQHIPSYHDNFVGTTTSEILRSQMQLLLARMSIRSTVNVMIDDKYSNLLKAAGMEIFTIVNDSGAKTRRPSYVINVRASYSREISDYVSRYTNKPLLSDLQNNGPFRRTSSHLVFPIQSITKRFVSEPVYNLEVEDDHSYIVEGVAVKNCQVAHSICSICHNYAETPDQYCSCIRERKTRQINVKNQECKYHERGPDDICPICACQKGKKKKFDVNTKVFEYNYGIKFIENSFVVNPACTDCGITEVIDPQKFIAKVAEIEIILPKLLKAASETPVMCTDQKCIKIAGQQELDLLNQALDYCSSVSKTMLDQKEQIDLEFLSDLVKVVADLQAVIDELTEQGYGRLQSPEQFPAVESQPNIKGSPPVDITHSVGPSVQPQIGGKIQTGPAGQVGTVTGPLAQKKTINLEKLSSTLIDKKQKRLDLTFELITKEKPNQKFASKRQFKKLNLSFRLKEIR